VLIDDHGGVSAGSNAVATAIYQAHCGVVSRKTGLETASVCGEGVNGAWRWRRHQRRGICAGNLKQNDGETSDAGEANGMIQAPEGSSEDSGAEMAALAAAGNGGSVAAAAWRRRRAAAAVCQAMKMLCALMRGAGV